MWQMRRPVLLIMTAFIVGIAVQYEIQQMLICAVLPAFLSAACFLRLPEETFREKRRKEQLRLVGLFLLFLAIGSCRIFLVGCDFDRAADRADRKCTAVGTVSEVEEKEFGYRFILKGRFEEAESLLEKNVENESEKAGGRENAVSLLVEVKGKGKSAALPSGVVCAADLTGRKVQVKGISRLPSGQKNPNLFDYGLYLRSQGIPLILETGAMDVQLVRDSGMETEREELPCQEDRPVSVPEITGVWNMAANRLAMLKAKYLEQLGMIMDQETSGLAAGMLFGDTSRMEDETYEAFQKNGIAHILSVSGLHFGVIYLYIAKLNRGRRSPVFSGCAVIFLFFYAALSEFSTPVVRSFLMILIHIASEMCYKRYDLTACTAVSALLILMGNPYQLMSTGFQLTYLAVFSLAFFLPLVNRGAVYLIERRKKELQGKALRLAGPMLVIQFSMIPVTAYMFNYFSWSAFLLNPPVAAVSGAVLPIGIGLLLISALTAPFPVLGGPAASFLFGLGASCCELLLSGMVWLNSLFFNSDLGYFYVRSPAPALLMLYYGLIFFLLSEGAFRLWQKRRRSVGRVVLAIAALSLILPQAAGLGPVKSELIFLDVGQGDCLLVRTPEGQHVLIDSGGNLNYDVGKKILLPFLLKNGIRKIDLAVVTHLHDDHYLGLRSLASELPVKRLAVYEGNRPREEQICREMGMEPEQLIYVKRGDRLWLSGRMDEQHRFESSSDGTKQEEDGKTEGVYLDILSPEGRSEGEYEAQLETLTDENNLSLVARLSYLGLTVLITGDMTAEDERSLLERDDRSLRADILKVAHHGSRYSSTPEFLEAVEPKLAVIQVGKNNFGHPHAEVIEKLRKCGIIIVRTDLNGAVMIRGIHEDIPQVRTMISGPNQLIDGG